MFLQHFIIVADVVLATAAYVAVIVHVPVGLFARFLHQKLDLKPAAHRLQDSLLLWRRVLRHPHLGLTLLTRLRGSLATERVRRRRVLLRFVSPSIEVRLRPVAVRAVLGNLVRVALRLHQAI